MQFTPLCFLNSLFPNPMRPITALSTDYKILPCPSLTVTAVVLCLIICDVFALSSRRLFDLSLELCL